MRNLNSIELRRRFRSCLRYKRAAAWQKPFLNPARFLRNQLRIRGLPARRAGDTAEVAAFHLRPFTIVNAESVSENIATHGIYEPELTEAFLRLIQPRQVVVDIGMHVGYYSTLFARLVGEQGRVYAFEPTPSTRAIAHKNVALFANITVLPHAVWSHKQQLTFHDYGPGYLAFNSFTEARLDGKTLLPKNFTVETVSLDEFRREIGTPLSFVKIDAESAEWQIIEGARNTLKSDGPIVSLEVGDFEDMAQSSRLIQLMAEQGYSPWELRDGRFTRHMPKARYDYDNLIFARVASDLSQY
jgi:FkbM family methyltransferase